mgnify:CR=1 FL=1
MTTVKLMNPQPNPPRRRRKMSALQRYYFGGGRRRKRRNAPNVANVPNRRRRRVRYLLRGRRRRRNPGFHPANRPRRNQPVFARRLIKPFVDLFQDSIAATAGIQVNNLVGNSIAQNVFKVTGTKRSMTKVLTAVVLPSIAAMVLPRWGKFLAASGAAAIAVEATKALNSKVYPTLGKMGNLLSTSDEENPVLPEGEGYVLKRGGMGYVPGTRYVRGGTYAERRSPVGAYVHAAIPSAELAGAPVDEMYGENTGVY